MITGASNQINSTIREILYKIIFFENKTASAAAKKTNAIELKAEKDKETLFKFTKSIIILKAEKIKTIHANTLIPTDFLIPGETGALGIVFNFVF